MKPTLKHLARLALVVIPTLWLVQHVILGPSGLVALHRKQKAYAAEMVKVRSLEQRNRELNQNVKELSSSPQAIESIAREQLHLTKPGEVVYTYPVAHGTTGPASASLH